MQLEIKLKDTGGLWSETGFKVCNAGTKDRRFLLFRANLKEFGQDFQVEWIIKGENRKAKQYFHPESVWRGAKGM